MTTINKQLTYGIVLCCLVLFSNVLRAQTYIELPPIDRSACGSCLSIPGYILGGTPDVINGNGPHPQLGTILNINGSSTSGGTMAFLLS